MKLNSYDAVILERVYILYSILIKEKENAAYIQETMKIGIQEFRNNKWNQNTNWANDFINLFSITSFVLDETDIKNFLTVIEGGVTQAGQTDLAIKALKNIGTHLPKDKIVALRSYSVKNATTDSSKMDAFEFLKSTREHATQKNKNLNEYVTFLVENFSIKIENFLEELFSFFSFISENSMVQLLINTSRLELDVLNSKLSTIQNVVNKFFMKLDKKQKVQVLFEGIREEIDIEVIISVLLESLDNPSRTNLLNNALSSEDFREKSFRMILLKLCAPSQNNISNMKFTNLLIDMFKENDDDYIIETSEILLHKFKNYRFNKEKKRIAEQIFTTFRNTNLLAKTKLLEVSKEFLLRDTFIEKLKEGFFTEEEEKLIRDTFNLRTKKRAVLGRD
ncbi:hypothetical protein [Sinobaca sp. H24]|uniref:hypothetical protein n=1 Tax=Sinobaca sp. H24 TaxID=2923376 RepID=UPI00207A4E25|nr:hypothetical protein [Sinobaca sp. H24]